MAQPRRFTRLADLTDTGALETLFGSVRDVVREPMGTVGFSGSRHERVALRLEIGETVRLVYKQTDLSEDWTAYRTGDSRGREAALLAEPAFAAVWDVFACPYVAFASEEGEVGLLMWDLAPHLLPDQRVPLDPATEDALLGRLAGLHACFWESPSLTHDWLGNTGDHVTVLGPDTGTLDSRRPPALALNARVQAGWSLAIPRLPARVADAVRESSAAWVERCASHPRTLIHGDVKLANFAPLPDGRVAAFDWEMVGSAPATVDLGWYLAVNASRLARPKEAVIARYRELLEAALDRRLEEPTWLGLERLAILSGAIMLLWSKALNVQSGVAGAEAEWGWWVDRLIAAC